MESKIDILKPQERSKRNKNTTRAKQLQILPRIIFEMGGSMWCGVCVGGGTLVCGWVRPAFVVHE